MVATAGRVFVSNAHNDSITVIDAKTNAVDGADRDPHSRARKAARRAADRHGIPRGDRLAAGGRSGHQRGRRDRHAPAGTAKMLGTPAGGVVPQPCADRSRYGVRHQRERPGHRSQRLANRILPARRGRKAWLSGTLRRGSIASFPLPDAAAVRRGDRDRDGQQRPESARPSAGINGRPAARGVKYVVLIVKENRTYDEVFGDISVCRAA